MGDFRSLTLQSGIVTQVKDVDTLVVGAGVKTNSGGLSLSAFSGTVTLAANNSLSAAAGTGGLDFSAASGSFKTSTGTVTVGPGAVTVSGAATFTAAGTALTVNNNASVTGSMTAGSLISTSLDFAGALTLGGTSATEINIGKSGVQTRIKGDLLVDGAETVIGTSSFQNNATFNGNVTLADGYTLSAAGPDGYFDFSAASGTFKTSQGAVSLNGNTTVTGTKTFSVAGGLATFGAGATVSAGNLTVSALGAGIAHVSAGGVFSSSAIVNADIDAAAAIAYSKLALTNSIVNADVSTSAAIAYSKLALTSSIVNADISSTAAIAVSKLAAGTAGQILLNNATPTPTWTTVSGDGYFSSSGVLTVTAAAGNFSVGGTLTVTGAATFQNNVGVDSGKTLTADSLKSHAGQVLSIDGVAGLDLKYNSTTNLSLGSGSITVAAGSVLGTTGSGNINLPNNASAKFQIEGSAVGSTVTAAALNSLTNGSDANAFHTHSGLVASTAHSVAITGLTTTNVDGYYVGYVSANNTMSKAIATSFAAANVFGVGEVANQMTVGGHAEALFEGSLSPAAGNVAYLSATDAGKLTNVAPTGSGQYVTRVGIILDASSYASNSRCAIVVQPMAPVAL